MARRSEPTLARIVTILPRRAGQRTGRKRTVIMRTRFPPSPRTPHSPSLTLPPLPASARVHSDSRLPLPGRAGVRPGPRPGPAAPARPPGHAEPVAGGGPGRGPGRPVRVRGSARTAAHRRDVPVRRDPGVQRGAGLVHHRRAGLVGVLARLEAGPPSGGRRSRSRPLPSTNAPASRTAGTQPATGSAAPSSSADTTSARTRRLVPAIWRGIVHLRITGTQIHQNATPERRPQSALRLPGISHRQATLSHPSLTHPMMQP